MPPLTKNRSDPLTVPQLRVLRELSDGALLTASKVKDRAGGVADLRILEGRGLVEKIELADDAVRESAWMLTPQGEAALNGVAMPSKPVLGAVEVPDIGAIAPWFGGCRRVAESIGGLFKGIKWVGVPFCGGLSEVPWMLANGVNAIALNDMHKHLVNMAMTMADDQLGAALYRRLRRQPFCAQVLRDAQRFCRTQGPRFGNAPDLECAYSYFICAWMSRSAEAGKTKEYDAGLAIRYGAGGGNSVLRYANAAGFGMRAWRNILARCSFSSDDCFEFLKRCNDRPDGGVYADPPWPGIKGYKHGFTDEQHGRLADALLRFSKSRVVVRTGGGPVIEKLYPRNKWKWLANAGRDQANAVATEWVHLRNA